MKFYSRLFIAALSALVFTPHNTLAQDELIGCKPLTEFSEEEFYPGAENINSTNDLKWKTGEALAAYGENIIIEGQIIDEECMPVEGAVVQIWQADASGKYVSNKDDKSPDPYFAGSGTTVTDNFGRYKFYSIFPGSNDEKSAPHINFRIKSDAGEFKTRMYFTDNPLNAEDPGLKDLAQNRRHRQTAHLFKIAGEQHFQFNITIKGKGNINKRY